MRKLLKKAAAVTLTAAMAASLTACGGSGDGASKETGEAQAAGENGEKIKLTLCIGRKMTCPSSSLPMKEVSEFRKRWETNMK